MRNFLNKLFVLSLSVFLTACGGGGGSSGGGTTSYTVGGTVSGLAGGKTVVLQNNGDDDRTMNGNDTVTFTEQTDGATYAITVSTQPDGQTCTVINGSGTIAGANITDVSVTCITAGSGYTVGGTVSGLAGGKTVVLQNNGGDNRIMTGNASFTFTEQADGATYAVTVSTQPDGQTCTVTNGSGTIAGANITDVSVTCVDNDGGGADTTAPVITLSGTNPVSVEVGSVYTDAGATALDDVDGGITASIVIGGDAVNTAVPGTYVITYDVSDSAGNPAVQVTRTVNVVDTTGPVITLLGSNPMSVEVGGIYTEPGATALDNYDGNITGSIVVGGDAVNAAVPGTYVIKYDVTDAVGNPATQVTRTVNVVPPVGAFYSNAPNWNDYVKNDGATQFNATNTAADGTETGGYSAVIHGGEIRSVDIGVASCTDQAATDALDAFDWVCDDSTGSTLLVSTGLKEGMNLSDLIDFDTLDWKNNSVTVTGTGAGLPFTTAPTQWWGNAILASSGGSLTDVGSDGNGEIYVVTSNPSAVFTMDDSKLALVITPGVTLTGSVTAGEDLISANLQNYLWLEGTIDAAGDNAGVIWNTVRFSVIRSLDASNADNGSIKSGVRLFSSSNNSLSNITTANNAKWGINIYLSSLNSLSNINTANNGNYGIYFDSSTNNSISNVIAANNITGIYLNFFSNNNSLSNVTAANNISFGVYLNVSSSNSLSNVTTTNNGTGIYLSGSLDNSLSNITTANNSSHGVLLWDSSNNNSLSNVTAANNGNRGVYFSSSHNNSLSNIAAVNNVYAGIYLFTSSNNYFTGLLKVGNNPANDCYVAGGTNPGLISSTCTNNGTSDATLINGVALASSFVGKVTTDDTANSSDSNGTATYPADPSAFDWTSFENSYRVWGIDGSAFPNADHRGRWTTGTGRIWDWSLSSADAVIRGILASLNGDLANTVTHTWSNASTTTYLRNTSEIMDDDIGNDNGLCESGEACLHTPNIGSYQGHGVLLGIFVGGDTITGAMVRFYTINGY